MTAPQELPLLFSEKSFMAARHYRPGRDPFVGVIEGRLKPFVQTERLNRAYKALVDCRTSLQLVFKKRESGFVKIPHRSAFKELKEFKNREAFLLWKNKTLDFETGPLHEMAVYKTVFKNILCFKFHHLILDGQSLFVFFNELTKVYHKRRTEALKVKLPDDFPAYQSLMMDFLKEEKRDAEEKHRFWGQRLKQYLKPCQNSDRSFTQALKDQTAKNNIPVQNTWTRAPDKKTQSGFLNSSAGSFNVFLEKRRLKQVYNFRAQNNIGLFYLFSALYSKVLHKKLDMDSVCIRIPFSARYHLKPTAQKNLLLSLSRSVPLFVPSPQAPLKNLTSDLQQQARALRGHLIMDHFPWRGGELNSFSKLKNQNLSLSMSYMPYREKGFLGKIQSFYWQESFLDLALFIILSEKRLLLSFSYNENSFSRMEVVNLSEQFQKEIKSL